MAVACEHVTTAARDVAPSANGCEDCLRLNGHWVNLRICTTCGHVGCCDSSPGKHATAHWHSSGHPLVRSFEPGEDWWWCYAHTIAFDVPGADPAPSFEPPDATQPATQP